MNSKQFIFELQARGIIIYLDGSDLIVEGRLKPATADYIRRHKDALVEALTPPPWAKGCHPVAVNGEIGWRKSPDEQAPFSPIEEADQPEEHPCCRCGKPTTAMLTKPKQQPVWCCRECFEIRKP